MLVVVLARFIGLATGTAVCLALWVLLVSCRRPEPGRPVAIALITVAGAWYVVQALDLSMQAVAGNALGAVAAVVTAAAILTPSLLLAFALAITGRRRALLPVLALAPMAATLLLADWTAIYAILLSLSAGWSAWLLWKSTVPGRKPLALSFAIFALTALSGPTSVAVIYGALAPLCCLLWLMGRHNLLGVVVTRRSLLVAQLGVASAAYLIFVRRVTDAMERNFDVFGPLLEVLLLFGAAIGWLPLYEWMTRFISRRSRLAREFGARVIEQAAPILDMQERADFLAKGVAETFALRSAHLVVFGAAGAYGRFGAEALSESTLQALEPLAHMENVSRLHIRDIRDREKRGMLVNAGFNYLFPLRYQHRVLGMLLIDSSPRLYLDEDDAILVELARQMSHSVEALRVIEEKIVLEKTLLRQEQLATLGTLAATIAHEVKNPLGPLKTLAQLMAEDRDLAPRYHRDLEFMLSEINRLNRCVDQLLSFSRPAPADSRRMGLGNLMETLARTLTREHADRLIRVEPEVAPDIAALEAELQVVQPIVLNLALNAIQASPPESKVRLKAYGNGNGKVVISVIDDGPGIAPELQEKIFEPFFTTKQQGTGLGLSIVRKNVRQLGGEVSLLSPVADGRGTSVTVTLPLP